MPEAIYRAIITRTIRYLSADRQDAARPAGNFVANNALAFLRAKYC